MHGRTQESTDDVVLQISEQVAEHWRASLLYFVAAGTGAMTITLIICSMVVNAQSV